MSVLTQARDQLIEQMQTLKQKTADSTAENEQLQQQIKVRDLSQ